MAHQHNTDYSCITMGTIIQTSTAILFHLEWVGIHETFSKQLFPTFSLAPTKSRMETFWYLLTGVILRNDR